MRCASGTPFTTATSTRPGKCVTLSSTATGQRMSLRQVFDCVYGLLLFPEPDDPLDSVLAAQFYEDRAVYEREAREVTRSCAACRSLEERRRDLLQEEVRLEQSAHPQHLICPLTLQLLSDPVSTRYGHTYERGAILEHLKRSQTDPLSRQ